MKNKELYKLVKRITELMPGFSSKGPLIFACPIEHVIRGLHFDNSAFNTDMFYVDVFFQPLCVPSEHLHFTFGYRLHSIEGSGGWSSREENLAERIENSITINALPFLEGASSLETAARTADRMKSTNTHILEGIGYCRALSGDIEGALISLEQIGGVLDRQICWQAEQADRVKMVIDLLRSNPNKAMRQFLEWEAETIKNVGLHDFWLGHRAVTGQ